MVSLFRWAAERRTLRVDSPVDYSDPDRLPGRELYASLQQPIRQFEFAESNVTCHPYGWTDSSS